MNSSLMKRVISIKALLIILSMQCYSQWLQISFPSTAKVNTMAVSGSSIFAGTNGDGILVSTDNGESWSKINEGLQSNVIYTIYIDSTNLSAGQTRIYTGTATGASISTNNGLSWETINSGLPEQPVTSFAVGNSTKIYAGTWSGIYYSPNYGQIWGTTDLSTTLMPVNSLAVIDNFIFASTYAGGLYYSANNGDTWEDETIWVIDYDPWTHTEVSRRLIPVNAMSKIGDNIIASIGYMGDIYSSPYYDASFSKCNMTLKYKPVLCFTGYETNLFAGNAVGDIYRSDADGLNWEILPTPLTDHAINTLAVNESYIFAVTEDGIWRLKYFEEITGADEYHEVPTGFVLEQNYPNPFNPTTTIKFSIPVGVETRHGASLQHVTLKIYSLLGQEVATLVNGVQSPGQYEVMFDASNLTSGIYIYKLHVGGFTATKKLMLVK